MIFPIYSDRHLGEFGGERNFKVYDDESRRNIKLNQDEFADKSLAKIPNSML